MMYNYQGSLVAAITMMRGQENADFLSVAGICLVNSISRSLAVVETYMQFHSLLK
jgi:hypothetical protein